MPVDVAALLQELDLRVAEGSTPARWLVRTASGGAFEVEPAVPADRLTAHRIRTASRGASPHQILHIGRTATDGVVAQAEAGEINILTEEPLRLIHDGRSISTEPASTRPSRPSHSGRPAWTRWALERYLLLRPGPSRQPVIAEAIGTSQQSVSRSAAYLGDLVADRGDGLEATDRSRLLEHWCSEYIGPGGPEFGWYSLDPVADQVRAAVGVARLLEVQALVSGDVAADQIAPWKLPASGRIYVSSPVDLAGDGFVAVPVNEASLVTRVPRDPTLWRLAAVDDRPRDAERLPLADAATVYWDLTASDELDNDQAAKQIETLLVGAVR